jgi:uncharacterized OB-fold protein
VVALVSLEDLELLGRVIMVVLHQVQLGMQVVVVELEQ